VVLKVSWRGISRRWNEHANAGVESRGQLLALVKQSVEQEEEAGELHRAGPKIRSVGPEEEHGTYFGLKDWRLQRVCVIFST
jgi:hypothetical protein